MQLIKHNQQPPHNCQQPIATTTQPPSSSTTQNTIQNKPIAHQHQIGSPTTTTTTSTTNPDKPITSTPLPTPTSKPKTFIIQVNPDSKPTIFIAVWHTKHQNIICSKSYKICNMLFGTFSTSSVDALMNIDMTRRERYLCNLKQSLFQKKKSLPLRQTWDFEYDTVVISYGIFFYLDMEAQSRGLMTLYVFQFDF